MKKSICISVAAVMIGMVSAGELPVKPIKCVSHQGERFDAPSHSAPAYRLAMERKADLMKLDVHYTKDSVPVLSHDGTLLRTMNWNVRIRDKKLSELKEKGRFIPVGGYKDEKIMTLREALAIVRDCPEFWFYTKTFPVAPEFGWKKGSCIEVVLEEFKRAGISQDRIIIATFNEKALRYAQKNLPSLRRIKHITLKRLPDGKLYNNFLPEGVHDPKRIVPELLKVKKRLGLWGMNLPLLAFQQGLLTGKDLQTLREAGLWCSIWFVNDPVTATFFSIHRSDAFVTDRIPVVRPLCEPAK